jgi:hypothetical protein
MTYDLDLVLAMTEINLIKFVVVARRFGLQPTVPVPIESLQDPTLIDQWYRDKGMLAFSLREPGAGGYVVDILVRPEVPFLELSAESTPAKINSETVGIASVEHLLVMKRSAGRPKDLLDIAALEKIQRGQDPNG